jgi:Ca2+-binding EF-hand superfamily protein
MEISAMTTIKKLLPVLFLSTLSVVAAQAADDKPATSAEETFKSLDKDSDQRLSKAEAASDKSLARTFAYLDADGDGYLTMREYTAHLKKPKS